MTCHLGGRSTRKSPDVPDGRFTEGEAPPGGVMTAVLSLTAKRAEGSLPQLEKKDFSLVGEQPLDSRRLRSDGKKRGKGNTRARPAHFSTLMPRKRRNNNN